MAELFNVVFRGDIAPGSTLADVRRRLRDHFQLDEARVDQLFCGRPVVVKKNLDRVRAGQFRDLLADMGALAQMLAVGASGASGGTPPAEAASPAVRAASTDSDAPTHSSGAVLAGVTVAPPGADVLQPQERRSAARRDIAVDHLSVDNPGADVLRPHERKKAVELHLDLSHLAVEPADNP